MPIGKPIGKQYKTNNKRDQCFSVFQVLFHSNATLIVD